MNIVNTIKTFFTTYLIPGTILGGAFLLFYIAVNVFFGIKRFYLLVGLFFSLISLMSIFFVARNKFVNVVRLLFFFVFLSLLGFISMLCISQHNPWAFVYEVQSLSSAAQNIYFQQAEPAHFPSKKTLFLTYLNLELKSLFSSAAPIHENLLGYDITFHSYQDLAVLFREIFIDKEYYVGLDKATSTIIDCGCNEGLSILFFKMMYPNSKILGIEAHPKSFDVLKTNINGNNFTNVTLINKAVFNVEGYLTFSANNSIGGHVLQAEDTQGIQVPSILLSTYVTEPVDLLKIDIEGAESIVIEELAQHNKLHFIKNIIMEFHTLANKHYNNFAYTMRILEEHGFTYRIVKTDAKFMYLIIHAYQAN